MKVDLLVFTYPIELPFDEVLLCGSTITRFVGMKLQKSLGKIAVAQSLVGQDRVDDFLVGLLI